MLHSLPLGSSFMFKWLTEAIPNLISLLLIGFVISFAIGGCNYLIGNDTGVSGRGGIVWVFGGEAFRITGLKSDRAKKISEERFFKSQYKQNNLIAAFFGDENSALVLRGYATSDLQGSKWVTGSKLSRFAEGALHFVTSGGYTNKQMENSQRLKWVRALLKKGLDINLVNVNGQTPLMLAIRSSSLDVVNLLLENGASTQIRDDEGHSPLFYSTFANDDGLEKFKVLAEYGWEISNKAQLLNYAARFSGDPELLEHLIKSGITSSSDLTYLASHNEKSFQVFKLLYYRGLRGVNPRADVTPLMMACRVPGSDVMVNEILSAGVDLDKKDKDGKTALAYAAENPRGSNVIKKLFDFGANPSVAKMIGCNPLVIAASQSSDKTSALRELLKSGFSRGERDREGWTPLMRVCMEKPSLENVKCLIKGTDCSARNRYGDSALHVAAKNSADTGLLELLLSHCNQKDLDAKGRNALQIACLYSDSVEVVKLLLEHFDVNSKNSDGFTPLMYSVQSSANPVEITEFLLSRGAKADLKNNSGKTALDLGRSNRKFSESSTFWKLNDLSY